MRPCHLSPAVAIALVLGLLSSPAEAVQFTHPPPYTLQYDHPLTSAVPPTPYVQGDAKAVVLGQLDADKIPDACLLHGTEVHFIRSVDRRNRWKKLAGSYSALAKLPQAQSNGGDGVLARDSSGLVKLLWNSVTGDFAAYPISGTSAWIDCKELQVVVAPSGTIQVLALSSDTRYILRAAFVPATGALSSLTWVPVARLCTSMVAVDFSTSTDLEYAIGGNWGVEVLSYTTIVNQLAYHPQTCNRSLLKRIPVANQQDRIAWVRAPTGTADFLSVVLPTIPTSTLESPIYLMGASIAQMTLSDLGEDARKELLLFADGSTIMLGVRRGTSTTFKDFSDLPFVYDLDVGNTIVGRLDSYPFDPGTGVLGGADKAPVPQVMDLDGDGDEDLFVAGHPGQGTRAMIFLGRVVDEEEVTSTEQVRPWMSYTCMMNQALDQAEIELTPPDMPTTGPANAATHVKITVWTQTENALYMNPSSEQSLPPISLTNPPSSISVVVPSLTGLGDGQIHLEFSYLDMNGTTMEAAFPAYHERLELEWFQWDVTEMFQHGQAGQYGLPTGFDGGIGGTSGRPPITPPSGGGG